MASWCQRDSPGIGGLHPAQGCSRARVVRAAATLDRVDAMDTTPQSTPDTADQPDELETADLPEVPDGTDDDDTPVDNPSGG